MKLFTRDSRIKDAVKYAEDYLNSPDFEKDVLSIAKFDESNIAPDEILKLFKSFPKNKIEIKCTYFGPFYRRVLGKTVGNGMAYVNSSRLGRQLWSIGATVAHEVGHVVDEYFPKASFGHGSNSSHGKEMTFPYLIGERAENWIKKQVLLKEAERLSMLIVLKRELVA